MKHSPRMTILFSLFAALLFCRPVPAGANGGVVTARMRNVQTHFTAYARVAPVALLRVNAAANGIVTGLHVNPGETVKAGTVLGRLTGPAVSDRLAGRTAALTGAREAVDAAKKILAGERRKAAAQLATQAAVLRAEADLAKAKTRLDTARAGLRMARAATRLTAPASGTILSIDAPADESVQAGQSVLTIQPSGSLWLVARYYGMDAAAIRVGMTGRFLPADGAAAIPIQVRALLDVTGPDGGRGIGLEATVPTPGWQNGDAGTVTLDGPKRRFIAVPTRALILDRGRWWVLVHTSHGNRRREVVPGPSRGTMTLIAKGLAPNTDVVAEDAYLEFHRDFSKQYLQPD